jgi:uncharacterized protein YqiB (DUF1249 family)
MLKREHAKLMALIKRWREDANELMRLIRAGEYPDHNARVRMYEDALVLRDCARSLKRRIDTLYRRGGENL